MFSQTSEYALRAVIWLAEHQNEGPVGNKRIAEDTKVPASYLSKILHDLASAGFLSSRRGVGGGFRLIIPPDQLTMLDVVNAVDPIKRVKTHALRDAHGELSPMHKRLDEAVNMVEHTLGDARICDLIVQRSDFSGPPIPAPVSSEPALPDQKPVNMMTDEPVDTVQIA